MKATKRNAERACAIRQLGICGTVFGHSVSTHDFLGARLTITLTLRGAASEAVLEGIPAVAFSGATASQVSYTTLFTSPTSPSTRAARIYSSLSVTLLRALLANPAPILPPGIALNVNYPATTNCSTASEFKFVLTRINADPNAVDAPVCGRTQLPDESSVVNSGGCFASVSIFDAATKGDVDAVTQAVVFGKLHSVLTCIN